MFLPKGVCTLFKKWEKKIQIFCLKILFFQSSKLTLKKNQNPKNNKSKNPYGRQKKAWYSPDVVHWKNPSIQWLMKHTHNSPQGESLGVCMRVYMYACVSVIVTQGNWRKGKKRGENTRSWFRRKWFKWSEVMETWGWVVVIYKASKQANPKREREKKREGNDGYCRTRW